MASEKFDPVILRGVPALTVEGFMEVTIGVEIKVNPDLVVFPAGVVTDISPDAPDFTTAVILVGDTTVNDAAGTPPKLTAVVPVKLVPVIVTVCPDAALVGLKEMILAAGMKLKPVSVAIPSGVVTPISPKTSVPITACIIVGETTTNDSTGKYPRGNP